MATGALTSEMTFNTHMKLSWGLVHLGYNTPEKYGCFNTATYQDVVDSWQHSDPVPKEKDILDAFDLWFAEQQKLVYREKREMEYPDLKEQLDALWHAIDSGALDKTSKFYTDLKTVKDKHPKPSE